MATTLDLASLGGAFSALDKGQKTLTNTQAAMADTQKAADRTADALDKLGSKASKVFSRMEEATRGIQKVYDQMAVAVSGGTLTMTKSMDDLSASGTKNLGALKGLLTQINEQSKATTGSLKDLAKAQGDAGKGQARGQGESEPSASKGESGKSVLPGVMKVAEKAFDSLKEFAEAADAMTVLDAKLKLAIGSSGDFAQAQRDVLTVAQANNLSLEQSSGLYTGLLDPIKQMGGGAKEAAAVAAAFGATLKLSSLSAKEAEGATDLFTKAMGQGKLQGESFNKLMDTSPALMNTLAAALGKSKEELQQMAEAGELTSDVVGNALAGSLGSLQAQAAAMPETVSGAMTRLKNDVYTAVDEINQAGGITMGIAGLTDLVRELIPVVKAELVGAFQSVGEWIGNNREALGAVWAQAKELAAEVWGLVKSVGEVAGAVMQVVGAVAQWVLQSGAVSMVVDGIRLALAYVVDTVTLVKAGFADAAGSIVKFLMPAIQLVADGLGKMQSLMGNSDAAKGYADIANNIRGVADAASNYAKAIYAGIEQGDTAVQRVLNTIGKATDAAKKAAPAIAGVAKLQPPKGQEDSKGETDKKTGGTAKSLTQKCADCAKAAAALPAWINEAQDVSDRNAEQALAADVAKLKEANDAMAQCASVTDRAASSVAGKTQADLESAVALQEGIVGETESQKLQGHALTMHDQEIAKLAELKRARDLLKDAGAPVSASKLDAPGVPADGKDAKLVEEEAKKAQAVWKETSDKIQNGLTDALMSGFESGKNFAVQLRDTLVNLFKDLVLRPVIKAIVSPVAQGLTSLLGGTLGLAGNAVAGTSQAGGILSEGGLLSGLGTTLDLFGKGLTSGLSSWMEGGSVTGFLGSGNLFSGGLANGLGGIAGALGPIAAGIAALVAISKATSGETRGGGQYGYNFGDGAVNNRRGTVKQGEKGTLYLEGPSGGEISGDVVRKAITSTVEGINGMLKSLGSAATLDQFQAGLETSGNGRGGVFAGGRLSTGATFGNQGSGDNYKGTLYDANFSTSPDAKTALANLSTDLLQTTVKALQAATDIPKSIADQLQGVDASTLTDDAAKTLLSTINDQVTAISGLRDALGKLPFAALKDLSFDAAAGLAKAAGGVSNLTSQLSSYYDKYYTDAEKTAQATKNVAEVFKGLGIDVPADMAAFRAVVENSFKDTSESGQKLSAGLLGVADAFAALHPAVAQAMAGWHELLDALPFDALKNLGYEAASALAAAAGGMDKLAGNLQSYYKDFYTPEQQRAQTVKNITGTLNAAGANVTEAQVNGATREQFIAVMEQAMQSAGSEGGKKLLNALLSVEGAFNQLVPAVDKAKDAVQKLDKSYDLNQQILNLTGHKAEAVAIARAKELATLDATSQALQLRVYALEDEAAKVADAQTAVDTAKGKLLDAYNAQAGEWQKTIDQFKTFADNLRAFRKSLDTGPNAMLSPEAQYFASKAEFDSVSAKAMAGDPEALQNLQGVSQEYLDASKAYYASSQGYFDDLARVKTAVSAAEVTARATMDVASLQLETQKRQLEQLGLLNDNVLSLTDALSAYLAAKASLDKAKSEYQDVAGTVKTGGAEDPSIIATQAGIDALNKLIMQTVRDATNEGASPDEALIRAYNLAKGIHAKDSDIDYALGFAPGRTAAWAQGLGLEPVPMANDAALQVSLPPTGDTPRVRPRIKESAGGNDDVVAQLQQTNATLADMQAASDETIRVMTRLSKSFGDLAQTTSLRGGAPQPVAPA